MTATLLWADGRIGEPAASAWTIVRADDAAAAPSHPVLPLARWLAATPAERRGAGVWLAPADDPVVLSGLLADVAVVAVEFPKFTDGRGYSIATLLRTRLGYAADLRAIGDVLVDQLFYLQRVGFTSFMLRADQQPQAALAALRTFSAVYQGAVDSRIPAWRRRAIAGVHP
jgi:uncharacterized protein (DUF934 family)